MVVYVGRAYGRCEEPVPSEGQEFAGKRTMCQSVLSGTPHPVRSLFCHRSLVLTRLMVPCREACATRCRLLRDAEPQYFTYVVAHRLSVFHRNNRRSSCWGIFRALAAFVETSVHVCLDGGVRVRPGFVLVLFGFLKN